MLARNTKTTHDCSASFSQRAWSKSSKLSCSLCDHLQFEYVTAMNCEDFLRSAQNGCAGCSVIASLLAAYEGHRGNVEGSLCILGGAIDPSRMQVWYSGKGPIRFDLFTTTGKTCPWPRLKRGTISLNTASEAAISTIKGWVEECFDSHEPCQQIRQKPQLPTRVVEIIDATTIRLREDCHEKGIYTCLSHCWGKKSFIRTTTASLAAHCDTISWDDLPTTFQDTIDITRRLGVRYIWIDSLCIIQDDLEDWRHEGSKMCDIYSGSYLTIAASRSEDSTGGCYSIADTIQETPQWFTNANNEQYSVNMRLSIQHELETSPLIQRAWFFQERVLSPRVVHFGPDELYWECRVGNTCECSDWRYVEESEYLPTRLGRRFETDKPYPTQSGLWHFVVRQYTRKKLQYETDIFPALQGVAKSLQHYGDYYAGLWRSETLLLDLLWCSWDHSRPAVCRAPSWSWASVTGRVYWYNYPQDFELLAEVVSIQTIPLGSDPFGQLLSGQLELKGPCFTGRIAERIGERPGVWCLDDSSIFHEGDQSGTEANICSSFYPDSPSELSNGTMATVMAIYRTFLGFEDAHCLVFACVDPNKHIYTRIGLATISIPEERFDGRNNSVLTII